jgi:xylulokinase
VVAGAVAGRGGGTRNRVNDLLIGMDLGSSGLKGVLAHPERGVLSVTERSYPMHRPHAGWAENDPEDWFAAVGGAVDELLAIARVDATAVGAVCIVSQRDVVALVDVDGAVLGPSIHWSDRRDHDETAMLFEQLGRDRIFDISGTAPIPGLVLPNLVWTRVHQPELFARARWALSPKDFVAHRLTGVAGTDPTSLTRSLINDWRAGGWSEDLCREAGIPAAILPPVTASAWESRAVLDERAQLIGLAPGTVLAMGGGDDPSSCLGCGVVAPGSVSIGSSSSSSWRVVSEQPSVDPALPLGVLPHVVPGLFLHEMVAVGTGTSMRWLRQLFSQAAEPPPSYEELLAPAATVAPGAGGVRFYPYVEGATVPHEDDRVRAAFLGIEAHHGRAHLVRAVLESVAFQYPPMLELIDRAGHTVNTITISDGESRSTLWNQLKADVVGRRLLVAAVAEATALGATILAGMALSAFPDAEAGIAQLVPTPATADPDLDNHARYAEHWQSWESGRRHVFAAAQPYQHISN